MKRHVLALLLLTGTTSCAAHVDRDARTTTAGEERARSGADVYLLAGQSNMQGLGRVAELAPDMRAAPSGVLFWNGTGFEPLDPTSTRLSTRAGEFGPELGFAHASSGSDPRADVRLVKFHRSGQALHHGWDGNAWAGAEPGPGRRTFYPGDSATDENTGRHYLAWLSECRAALAAIEAEGLAPRLRGVVWMQGEQDSKHELSASTYARSLRHLRARLGEDLGVEMLPWVYGQVLPHEPVHARFTHRAEIRAQMAALDARSKGPEATPGMWMVPTDSFPLHDDGVHYDTTGQRMLGTAFADAMRSLQHAIAEREEHGGF